MLALGGEGHALTLLGGLRVEEMPLIAQSRIAHLADWGEVHGFLGDAIMALAGLHAAPAIDHHARLKDGALLSMLPRRGARRVAAVRWSLLRFFQLLTRADGSLIV